MTNAEHTALIQQIASNLGDATMVTGLLATLSSDYTEANTRIETLTPFEVDNEALRNANMRLFTQIGSQDKAIATEAKLAKDPVKATTTNEPLKFEGLFDDKGGLK